MQSGCPALPRGYEDLAKPSAEVCVSYLYYLISQASAEEQVKGDLVA